MMKEIQKLLLNNRIAAKLYWRAGGGYDWDVLVVRVRWSDRFKAQFILNDVRRELERHSVWLKFRYTLMPWECRSLLQVVSYIEGEK